MFVFIFAFVFFRATTRARGHTQTCNKHIGAPLALKGKFAKTNTQDACRTGYWSCFRMGIGGYWWVLGVLGATRIKFGSTDRRPRGPTLEK